MRHAKCVRTDGMMLVVSIGGRNEWPGSTMITNARTHSARSHRHARRNLRQRHGTNESRKRIGIASDELQTYTVSDCHVVRDPSFSEKFEQFGIYYEFVRVRGTCISHFEIIPKQPTTTLGCLNRCSCRWASNGASGVPGIE